MVGIVRIALTRPYTFVVLALLIVLFGVRAAVGTPTDIFPNIGIPVVSAVWQYAGMPPRDMSGRVIYFYERQLTAMVSDIQHIESQSLPGYGIVKIYFQPNVNVNAALAEVTAASQTVLKLLPPGITPPYVLSFNASSVPIMQLALSGSTVSQSKLFDLGQNMIRPQLATIAGAAVPSPYGGIVRQVQVDLNQDELQAHHLSPNDVVTAIQNQNLVIPGGTEKIGPFDYEVDMNASPGIIAHMNAMPVTDENGTVITVGDVAYVHDGHPPQTNIVHVDGRRAVLMTVLKAGSASTLDIIQGVKDMLPRLRATLPKGVTISIVSDQSLFVTAAVSGVIREGAIAAALTGLMILVFLGSWRSTLIITISIPLAILFSITMLSITGQTINVMTLGGLALAVGILVDDATVTIENINWHIEQGKPIEKAILDGAHQIVTPAFVSLLCICIVFVPMFTLGGVSGYLFKPLAMAVIFALIGSFILSRTLVPTMANYLLRGQGHQQHGGAEDHPHHARPAPPRGLFARFHHGFEHYFSAFRERYERVLHAALQARVGFIVGFLAVVLLSFGLAPFLGSNFFPTIDSGQIALHVRGITGLRIEDMARLCGQIETDIRGVIPPDQLIKVVDNIGLPFSGINMAYNNTGTIGYEDADLLISLSADHAPTARYIEQLRTELPRRFPGTTFSFEPADITTQILNFGLPAPLDIRVTGPDLRANDAYAKTVLKKIALIAGVADPHIQQVFNQPTLRVNVDRTLADEVGLTENAVASAMLVTLTGSGQQNPTFWLNPRNGVSYPVVTQLPEYDMTSMNSLDNVPVRAPNGTVNLLGGLSTIVRKSSPAVVTHYNVQPAIDIYANVHGRDLGAVTAAIQRVLNQTKAGLPAGAVASIGGQATTMQAAFTQLFVGLAFAIVLIYFIIVVNFQSWIDPFVIITALPAALAGIVWMLFLTGTTLSVPALTGAIMCMGVATANSILVVSFARERLAHGDDAVTAAMSAGAIRFRPVLMTALAMIIGMLPMALAMGDGGEQNAPLGRAVIGGLMCATVATLLFVPAVFALVHGRRASGTADDGDPAPMPVRADQPEMHAAD
jgi:multidrug efflux pump subunit AcrB